jgi:hypothetical protein
VGTLARRESVAAIAIVETIESMKANVRVGSGNLRVQDGRVLAANPRSVHKKQVH